MECKQQLDTFYLGDALRALNYIPTNELVEKLGGTLKKGEKYITIEEFLPIIQQLNRTKDMGNYEVFVECLRLYDRNDDGGIMKYDLENILCNMGKQLLILYKMVKRPILPRTQVIHVIDNELN